MIEIVKKEYFGAIGSNVTLSCHITNHGAPMATFAWRRRGLWLSNNLISMNDTHFSLTLSNLREDDAGRYSCAAQDVLSVTYKQDVSLYIKGTYVDTIHRPLTVAKYICNQLETELK